MNSSHRAPAGRGQPVRIACMNLAKTKLGVPLGKLTATLQKCYDRHFLPIWGYPVKLYNTRRPRRSDWQLVYLDNADMAGKLGYHKITKRGQPIAKVFVETALAAGEAVSVVACHELFEMAIDPIANLWALGKRGLEYAYEMSDPVEEDTFPVDGLPMSNFVYPAWFEPNKHPRGTKFDHLGLLKKPFSMSKSGYLVVKKNGKVKHVFGSKAKESRFKREDRRCHRSEYRKPRAKAKLVRSVGDRAAEKNMKALLRARRATRRKKRMRKGGSENRERASVGWASQRQCMTRGQNH
jgi:hypothetical protein